MERLARRYLMAMGCAIMLSISLGTDASAQATKVPISGEGAITELVDGGTTFTSDDGIEHVRNRVFRVTFFIGDLVGEQLATLNSELDPATGEGRSHGVVSFSGIHVPSGTEGTFEGSVTGDIFPDSTSWCGAITETRAFGNRGGGGFAGMKRSFVATLTCPFFPFVFVNYEGEILDPSGTLQP